MLIESAVAAQRGDSSLAWRSTSRPDASAPGGESVLATVVSAGRVTGLTPIVWRPSGFPNTCSGEQS